MTTISAVPPHKRSRAWFRAFLLSLPMFALGAVLSAYVVRDYYTRSMPQLSEILGRGMASQYALMQYRQADYRAAKEALQQYLGFLENSLAHNKRPIDDGITWAEKIVTLSRLALLEESNRQTAEAEKAWLTAEALARQSSWKDPSRESLRQFVQRIDSSPGFQFGPKSMKLELSQPHTADQR